MGEGTLNGKVGTGLLNYCAESIRAVAAAQKDGNSGDGDYPAIEDCIDFFQDFNLIFNITLKTLHKKVGSRKDGHNRASRDFFSFCDFQPHTHQLRERTILDSDDFWAFPIFAWQHRWEILI